MTTKVYGARFGPEFGQLRETNQIEDGKSSRLTIFNDAYTFQKDDGAYAGKKNFRFVIGSTEAPVIEDGCYRFGDSMLFKTDDRSLYLRSSATAPIYIDEKCNFSSTEFEKSLTLNPNMVYRVDYLNRKLGESEWPVPK